MSEEKKPIPLKDVKLIDALHELLPMYGADWNWAVMSTVERASIGKLLFYNEVYKRILGVPGVICEFGVHWGGTAAVLANLHLCYEPYNLSREYYGFDTFSGFPADPKDGEFGKAGLFNVPEHYMKLLGHMLELHNARGFVLHQGDASETVPAWIKDNPAAIISLAILDFDIYQPTRDVLEAIIPRLVKGSVLVFDKLNHPHWPGETTAVNEVLGLNNLKLHRFPYHTYGSFAVFGE
jgi:hypothetical protein